MTARVPVTFEPAGVTTWVAVGSTVAEAAKATGLVLVAPCGGRGVCGACGVRVRAGALAPADEAEQAGLRRAPEGVRLACRAQVVGPVSVRPLVARREVTALVGPGARAGARIVAGVDLGTTSVAAALVDAETGLELARASVPNRQQAFGADVLSRLSAAAEGSRAELRALAEESVLDAVAAAAAAAGVASSDITRLVIAGNSAMAGLLTGADTSQLATYPFVAPATGGPLPCDSAITAALAPGAEMRLIAPIAGFVGGDALAATLASGMIDAAAPVLLVDFGTNAEVVLAAQGRLTVASAAAGPAFEGVGISCGGPAAEGAITRLRISGDGSVGADVLGSGTGKWLSGSGLVSAIAELRRAGAIDASGRLSAVGVVADRVATDVAGVTQIRLGEDPATGPTLSQLDIRAFQLAKAAVRVGIGAVLAAAGVDAADVERLCVAGAFGVALMPEDLVELGIVPARLATRMVHVGNASLEGAAAVALDPSLAEMLTRAAVDSVHIELAADPGFARALADATALVSGE